MLRDLTFESMYSVEGALSDYTVGPMGGPMYLSWTLDPKPKLDHAARQNVIAVLRSKWTNIVGSDLRNITLPTRLTGTKGRRLLVAVKADREPPWGSWSALARDERRRMFTAFRAAINRELAPHVVDHIDFIRVQE